MLRGQVGLGVVYRTCRTECCWRLLSFFYMAGKSPGYGKLNFGGGRGGGGGGRGGSFSETLEAAYKRGIADARAGRPPVSGSGSKAPSRVQDAYESGYLDHARSSTHVRSLQPKSPNLRENGGLGFSFGARLARGLLKKADLPYTKRAFNARFGPRM